MPFYVSTWLADGSRPTVGDEWIDLGPIETRNRGQQDYALVWSSTSQSAPGVFLVANSPDEVLSNPRVRSLNNALDLDLPRMSLAETVRHVWRHYPWRWAQPPINNDGTVTIKLGPLLDSFSQDDDFAHLDGRTFTPPVTHAQMFAQQGG